ncbi:MAG: hypothetical protein EOM92_21005 [Gammaproteobacteria bacterium]|jgi:hypothetical protein|nr:hypothetical protein [Gammaproteobacteria bacterium]
MSPDIIALQYENILLRLLLEHATGQTSKALELYRQTAEDFHREALSHRKTIEAYSQLAHQVAQDMGLLEPDLEANMRPWHITRGACS